LTLACHEFVPLKIEKAYLYHEFHKKFKNKSAAAARGTVVNTSAASAERPLFQPFAT